MPIITKPQGVDIWSFNAAPTIGNAISVEGTICSASLVVEGTGAVSAAGVIEVTNTPDIADSWTTLFTLSASGTNVGTDSGVAMSSFAFNRARITAISGTAAVAHFTNCSR